MRHLRLLMGAISFLILAVPAVSFADVNDFTVTDFTGDYTLTKADPQGQLNIDEHITVDFSDYNHGIERALPEKYNGQDQHIKVSKVLRDDAVEPYTTYASNGNEVLQIGDANKTITGQHTYEIEYSMQNVIRFTSGHDELDWNTNGTQWEQPFEYISATVHLPDGITTSKVSDNHCVTGLQGSTASDCTVEADGNGFTYQTTHTLEAGENMTFVEDFPAGTFQKPTAADWWKDHIATIIKIALPPLLALAFVYPYWRKNGKDLKGRGTIIPEYGPPDGMRAAEADVINHYKLGKNAISATIIDLAIRKYLKIIEGTSDGILGMGKHKTYSFQRLPAPANDSLKPYEQTILDGLFASGDTIQTTDLKNKFYVTATLVQKSIPESMTAEGYFPSNPRKTGNWLHIVGIALIFGSFWLGVLGGFLNIGFLLAGVIILIFATLMPRRTQKGVDAKDTLAGLKLYMDTAEKDRIAMLQSVDARYAPKSDAPQQTVELFEKLLPFAMIMGVEETWAKQFESIYTTPPDWYSGNWTAFNAGLLIGSLNDSMGAMNSSFAAPSSSGSGSGGGFSGGGGGGGGGGGW